MKTSIASGIAVPAHVFAGIDAAEAIQQRSTGPPMRCTRFGASANTAAMYAPSGLTAQQRENEVEPNLQQIVGSHSNHSGFSSATAR